MAIIIKYEHHGKTVFVQQDLIGRHREYCLCWKCGKFSPDDHTSNCPIANLLFAVDQAFGIVTPVWECPGFDGV